MTLMDRSLIVTLVLAGCTPATHGLAGESDAGTADDTATGGDTMGTETAGDSGESGGGETGGGATCGNNVIEASEACDGDDLAGQSCEDLGFVGGELVCSGDCTFDATGCSNQVCGNGIIEGDEECDGGDLGGVNCVDLGFGPGLPLCTESCTFDTSTCATLGEGEPCGIFSPCPNNLHCVSETCYDGSSGDPCEHDGQCQSGDCVGAQLFQDGICN